MFIQEIWRFFSPKHSLPNLKEILIAVLAQRPCLSLLKAYLPSQFSLLLNFIMIHRGISVFSPLLARHRFEFLLLICCCRNLYLYFTHLIATPSCKRKRVLKFYLLSGLPFIWFSFYFLPLGATDFCKTEMHFISICWHTDASVLAFTWFHSELNQYLKKKDSPPVEGKYKWRWSFVYRLHDPK